MLVGAQSASSRRWIPTAGVFVLFFFNWFWDLTLSIVGFCCLFCQFYTLGLTYVVWYFRKGVKLILCKHRCWQFCYIVWLQIFLHFLNWSPLDILNESNNVVWHPYTTESRRTCWEVKCCPRQYNPTLSGSVNGDLMTVFINLNK